MRKTGLTTKTADYLQFGSIMTDKTLLHSFISPTALLLHYIVSYPPTIQKSTEPDNKLKVKNYKTFLCAFETCKVEHVTTCCTVWKTHFTALHALLCLLKGNLDLTGLLEEMSEEDSKNGNRVKTSQKYSLNYTM